MVTTKQISRQGELCDIECFDEVKVQRVQQSLSEQRLTVPVRMFKALADETRMKIAYALTVEEEMCVCDVAHVIGSSTATASHHLRLLRDKGLAKSRKEGKLVFYSLDDEHVRELVRNAVAHGREGELHG
ncbi:ArsR/SmtB family transcription factor [Paenibacillus tarimensis]|uniref:ArsR/SmtB family transcription factor n=1 Tax=Paenibacillus tarimensis TaxID=416012 RepID=UPI001F1756AB|nr:metalloregulator ArsR/SmtB family transcription factor [Paenibacillus tarimensis]MCF2943576.1 metalloregulator ArsR/SmtB family transcription factor [Paenibacillus tarimensis]